MDNKIKRMEAVEITAEFNISDDQMKSSYFAGEENGYQEQVLSEVKKRLINLLHDANLIEFEEKFHPELNSTTLLTAKIIVLKEV